MLQMRDSAGFFVGSCVQKCGMPSSHAAFRSPTTMKKICKICTLVLLTPFMPYGALTYDEYMAFLVFWSLIWLPVPFMRVVLLTIPSSNALLAASWARLRQRRGGAWSESCRGSTSPE
eukprot:CAMPEP_0115565036 /NCGR_PEP_ID=MMETSP0271-20121206/102860_1 /TAXON_ID=71861 /ORGANISM="Scrippsiella trochoidea, Strain CCMP3099" /LENGTH=117 /DNA_ID=CAMNT_0002999297 /DNA_START=12 /DNA_END=366 /DNA_ORIENTATION=-